MSYWHLLRCALASLANLSQERLSYARSLPGHRRVSFEPLEERRLLSLTLHVDRDASGGGDGRAWETAYSDLQAALSETALRNTDGDGTNDVDSIWIAEGTYKPSALLNGDDDRSASFSLLDGVDLYGGFAGSEVTVGERDRSAHVTTLSGDIGVADDTADNAYSVVHCDAGVIATLDGVSITGGMADGSSDFASVPENSGGGIYSAGNLTVANTTVSDNTTVGYFGNGGGIYNLGTLTVTESALVDNVAGWAGGGICSVGTLVVSDSTMSGNFATSGGGLSGSGAITVTNSTFAHNWGGLGGGIENGGTLSVTNTTIAENAAGLGGGIYCGGPLATETLSNTIVARNEASSGPDIYQSADTLSGSHNLIGSGADHTGLIHGEDGNQVGTAESPIDPRLSVWRECDSGWWGFYPLHGSPAIDVGDNGLALGAQGQPLAEDILGNPRVHDGTVDIGAVESLVVDRPAQTYTVMSLEDKIVNDGVLTFIEAFFAAGTNQPVGDGAGGSLSSQDTIRFADGLSGTVVVDGGELFIIEDLRIEGPGADRLTFDAAGANRVFSVQSGIAVALSGMTITGGAADVGGAVFNVGTLTVENSSLAGNTAERGGAIGNDATLAVVNSTLSVNSANDSGGAISSSASATLKVANSVFVGNSASGSAAAEGGAISNSGTLVVTNSTFTDNSAGRGGGISSRGTLTVNNSIVFMNSGRGIEGDYGGLGNLINIDPGFVIPPSAGVDGEWKTGDDELGNLRLTGRSPAINWGSNALAVGAVGGPLTTDLAGNPRIADETVDCGAYEFQGPPDAGRETPSLVVSITDDRFDLYDGDITLREAIHCSRFGAAQTVTFDAVLNDTTIALSAGELQITHAVTIDASALSALTVDGGGNSRVFYITDDVTLSGLTITGGQATRGGGVYNSGQLTITDSMLSENWGVLGGGVFNGGVLATIGATFSENTADEAGGGIYCGDAAATVTVMNSTFVRNSASSSAGGGPGRGGGVYSPGTMNIANSTFSGNSAFSGVSDPNAESSGGAIWSDGMLTITNSTVVGNSAGAGGGISSFSTATVNNTIVAGNEAGNEAGTGAELSGSFAGSHNLIGDGSGQSGLVHGTNGNEVGTAVSPIDPMLGEWTRFANGLWGYPLVSGSPAVDAGSNALLPDDVFDLDGDSDASEPLPIDVAGSSRVQLGIVDVGACELFAPQFVVADHYPKDEFWPFETSTMTFVFSRELTTLAAEDLVLTGPDGSVEVPGASRTRHGDGWSEYTVDFEPITSAGEYHLTVLPTVRDADGAFLDRDRDERPGETSDDRYVVSWKLAGPMVESHAPSGWLPSLAPLTHFDIVFNRAMDQGSFSLEDVRELTGPGGAIVPTGYTWLSERTVRITFEPVAAAGTVSITIGPGVRDQWGNPLDQNQNAVAGESVDTFNGSVMRSISGTISGDTVIPSSTGEFPIGTLTIVAGATLTIESGVTLKFGAGGGVIVHGRLVTLGEVEQPVVFTSSATSPGSSAWTGIRVMSSGSIDLDHTEVRHAAKAVDANSSGAQAVLKNTTLRDGGFGVYVYSPYAEVTAENCLIADNANTGIFVRADSRHSLKNCTIVGNGLGGSAWHGAGIHLGGSILTLENCIVAFNHTGLDHSGDPPTATIRSSLFYNPGGQEIAWDGDPGMPDLAANGNVTADPMFVDRSGGNYELASLSPAIDAGTGVQASIADRLGRLRYDDRGMPNVGHGFPAYVDMGALERQVDSPLADLAVTHVSDPTPEVVTVGDTVGLEWTVRNVGAVDTTGAWQDRIYLSSDPFLDAGDLLLAAVAHSDPLVPGSDYTEYLTLTIPSTSGPKYVLVHTQFVGGSFHEAVETNNLGVSAVVLAVDVPLLELGVPSQGATTMRQWCYHRFEAEAGRTVLFRLDSQAGVSSLGLRRTLPPTFSHFDELGSASQLDVSVRLLEPVDGTYYVGVYGNMLPGGGAPYTLYADLTTLDIHDVTPNEISNTGTATIRIVGDNFHPDAEVQLIDPDGAPIEGQEYYAGSTRLFTTFNLAAANAVPGLYDVVVTNPGPESVTLADAVKVVRQHESSFMARLSVPAVARPGRVIECRIEYTNSGKVDIPAPILTLDSGIQGTAWRLPSCGDWVEGPDFHLMGLSSEGLPTILRPGQTETLIVQMRVPFGRESVSVCLSSVGALPTDGSQIAINWEEFETDVRPPGMDDATWADLLAEFQAEIGDTWGDYVSMLREDVEHWHEQGQTIHCVRELFGMPDPDPEGHKQDCDCITIYTSYTPEDKFGPAGYDAPGTAKGSEARYIPADQTLGYRVEFWNKPDAEVPTQDAIVMDYIDPAVFDVSTLEITRVGFLGWDLPVSSGQVVDTRIDCMPEMNIAVEIRAGLAMNVPGFANNGELDENTLVFWFHTIDPETGEWPEDPMAGFLPPFNRETGFEIGWVEYTVDPAAGLVSGTQLANVAYVEFDFAGDIYDHPAPKVDPSVDPAVADPWINTIDVDGPTSQVETLPATTENEVLTILWAGQDDVGGSGIGGYDIYVSTDDGPFELWLNDTIDTEALFTGSRGSRYAFYSIATDNVGHQEDASQAADATITLVFPLQVDAGPDQAAVEGDSVDLAGPNFTYDGDLANLVLTINWGDGTEEPGTLVPSVGGGTISDSHCYADNGQYIVTLSFSQSGTASVEDSLTVTVSNAVPVANAGGPYSAMENSPIAFVGSATDAGTLDTLTYEWDLDYDGVAFVPGAIGQSVTHIWADDHTGNVALRVTDNDGAWHLAVASLNVTNADPIADAGGPFTVVEGGAVQLDGSGSTDPGSDALTYDWDLDGDGEYDDATGVRPQFSAAGLDGSVVVTVGLRVSDDDGGIDTASVDVNITRPEPIRLGAVDFAQLSAVSLADGNAWYELTAVRSGQLTAIASTASGSTTATLYDSSKTLLTVSTAMNGAERLDHSVQAGETYFVRIAGDSTDAELTLANLVNAVGTEVQVFGTDGVDAFEFAPTSSYVVTINGVEYDFNETEYETFVFDGSEGNDTATLTGGPGVEVARFFPDHGTFGENGFLVSVSGVNAITARGGGGADSAFLYDSPGDDEFISRKGYGKLSGDGFLLETFDFMTNYGYATTTDGGSDVAFMEDSSTADKFKFDWPKPGQFFGKMYGGGDYYNRAKNFEQIVATMTDGTDTVRLFDSEGDDTFYGRKEQSRMVGPGYDVTVSGYSSLAAYASIGMDLAQLEDSEDDDTTRARPHKITLWGGDDADPTYEIMARRFDEYHFEGKHGGFDRAKLHDTVLADHVHAAGNSASLYTNDSELELLYQVAAFEWVKLYATDNGSQDTLDKEDALDFDLVYDKAMWDELP